MVSSSVARSRSSKRGPFSGKACSTHCRRAVTATVPFSLERGLAVESERKYNQLGARLFKIEAGELTIERDSVSQVIYRIKNGTEQPAKVVVRHPRLAGARLYGPPPGTEDNVGTGLALVPADVKPRGKTELTVDERVAVQQHVNWMSPLADEAVQSYLKDSRADRALSDKLRDAWTIREKLEAAGNEQIKLESEQAELEKASRETRSRSRQSRRTTRPPICAPSSPSGWARFRRASTRSRSASSRCGWW